MTVRVGIIGCGAVAINRHVLEYAGNRNCIIEACIKSLKDGEWVKVDHNF
jgi:hypothetical protein